MPLLRRGVGESTDRRSEDARPRHNWALGSLLVLVGYFLLAVLVFHNTWASPSSQLVGGCCDSPAPAWFLNWASFSILHGLNPLYTHYLGSPSGVNVMWQPPAMLVVGILVSPIELIFGPFVTYNFVITFALAGSAFASYITLNRWVGGRTGPFIGGLLFGFSPFMLAQSYGHPDLMVDLPIPLFFLALSDLLFYQRHRAWVSGAQLGGLFALQFLISQELSAGLLVATAVVIVAFVLFRPRSMLNNTKRLIVGVGAASAVSTLSLLLPLLVEFKGSNRLRGLLRPENTFVSDVANLIIPNPYASQFAPPNTSYVTTWSWDIAEIGIYIGLPLLILLVVVVILKRRDLVVQTAAFSGILMLILSMGPSFHIAGIDLRIPLPWALAQRLPLLPNLLPERLAIFWQLAVAVLVATAVHHIERTRTVKVRILSGALLFLALTPLLPLVDFPTWKPTIPTFFKTTQVDRIPNAARVLLVPFPRDQIYNVEPMLWQLAAHLRFVMPGGYILLPAPSGFGLAETGGTENILTAELDQLASSTKPVSLKDLDFRALRAELHHEYAPSFVVVGPMPNEHEAVVFTERLIGHMPQYEGGVYIWHA